MVAMVLLKEEFGPMAKHEKNAVKGDLYTTEDVLIRIPTIWLWRQRNGSDLLIPIGALIVCCVIGMLYTGGFSLELIL